MPRSARGKPEKESDSIDYLHTDVGENDKLITSLLGALFSQPDTQDALYIILSFLIGRHL